MSVKYRAIYGEGHRVVEVEVHKPYAPSRESMTETPTGRTWPHTKAGTREAKAAVRTWNEAYNAVRNKSESDIVAEIAATRDGWYRDLLVAELDSRGGDCTDCGQPRSDHIDGACPEPM